MFFSTFLYLYLAGAIVLQVGFTMVTFNGYYICRIKGSSHLNIFFLSKLSCKGDKGSQKSSIGESHWLTLIG